MGRIRAEDVRELLTRVLGPGLLLWALILGGGLLVTRPLATRAGPEIAVSRELESRRTPDWNAITFMWSHLGNIEIIVVVCAVVSALVLWRTRDWCRAAVPAVALLLEAAIFSTVSILVARARPPVEELDVAPPTTSYPSGHVGATTALYLTFALLALGIRRGWLRRITIIGCLVVPVLVAFARLYRGMHYPSDVAAGLVNGIVCALLAFNWYRHSCRDDPR